MTLPKGFKRWLKDNTIEVETGYFLQQSSQYKVRFSYNELIDYYIKEFGN